jgi:hypothetical protein
MEKAEAGVHIAELSALNLPVDFIGGVAWISPA